MAVVCQYSKGPVFPKSADILNSSITLAAIFAGFLATAKSMLVSMSSPTLDKLKRTSFYGLLISYLAEAVWMAMLFCAFCMLGYFVSGRGCLFTVIWTTLAACSVLTWVRVTRSLLKLMSADA